MFRVFGLRFSAKELRIQEILGFACVTGIGLGPKPETPSPKNRV